MLFGTSHVQAENLDSIAHDCRFHVYKRFTKWDPIRNLLMARKRDLIQAAQEEKRCLLSGHSDVSLKAKDRILNSFPGMRLNWEAFSNRNSLHSVSQDHTRKSASPGHSVDFLLCFLVSFAHSESRYFSLTAHDFFMTHNNHHDSNSTS